MIAEYTVKMHGKWYHAGDELPSPAVSTVEDTENAGLPSYTKTEINRMSIADLRALAEKTGVDGGSEMTGAELKQYFISLFGL